MSSADVINMLDNMIKAVDEELSDEGLTLIGDAVLPHVQHWDRLLRNQPVGSVIILPALLVSSALAALAEIVFTSIYLCSRVRRCVSESSFCDSSDTDMDGCLGSSTSWSRTIRMPVSWMRCLVGLRRVSTKVTLIRAPMEARVRQVDMTGKILQMDVAVKVLRVSRRCIS
ncbi:hypothetical protein OG21DRAFT_1117029 [Imleria badia]|nr:hypothetical protein OG21DRAFT_1117029 [Imleria badia]